MKFFARAPGKIIITGEHFVVHDSYALAAAINRGATVEARSHDSLEILSKNLGLKASYPHKVPPPLSPVAESVAATLKFLGIRKGVKLVIHSDLPSGSGLGSSSAVAVASISSVFALAGEQPVSKKVVELAMISERMVHGNPSGIDPTVSCYGGVLLFQKGKSPELLKIERPVEFVVAYSGIGRKTSRLIDKVSKMKASFPHLFSALASSSTTLSRIAGSSIASGDLTTLGSILNFYHMILSRIGASTKVLDSMVETALSSGCLGAKLTGAGGGGCIIALPKPSSSREVLTNLSQISKEVFIVRVPVEGVRVWRE